MTDPEPDLLTYDQAAKALGISRTTLYRILDDGDLTPVVIPRRQLRIRQSDIDALLIQEQT